MASVSSAACAAVPVHSGRRWSAVNRPPCARQNHRSLGIRALSQYKKGGILPVVLLLKWQISFPTESLLASQEELSCVVLFGWYRFLQPCLLVQVLTALFVGTGSYSPVCWCRFLQPCWYRFLQPCLVVQVLTALFLKAPVDTAFCSRTLEFGFA